MVEQDHAAEMSRAANMFASAVAEFSRQVERWSVVRREPLSEEEAAKLADEAVHRVRSDLWAERKPERPPLPLMRSANGNIAGRSAVSARAPSCLHS